MKTFELPIISNSSLYRKDIDKTTFADWVRYRLAVLRCRKKVRWIKLLLKKKKVKFALLKLRLDVACKLAPLKTWQHKAVFYIQCNNETEFNKLQSEINTYYHAKLNN